MMGLTEAFIDIISSIRMQCLLKVVNLGASPKSRGSLLWREIPLWLTHHFKPMNVHD
jgi:hypothetical protein